MMNFLRVRHPSVSLLYGKRPIQRIKVGGCNTTFPKIPPHEVELPQKLVDSIYENVDENTLFHQNTYQPLKWKNFLQLKLDAFYFMEASQAGDAASKSALTSLDWFPQISTLYAGQVSLLESGLLKSLTKSKFTYPIQGKNIGINKIDS